MTVYDGRSFHTFTSADGLPSLFMADLGVGAPRGGSADLLGRGGCSGQALQNLVENAVKFMGDQGSPRIEIGLRQVEGESDPIFYVRDNGIGIDPRYQDRVFGLFERLDQDVAGTGVGLTLAQRIVETHGGRIWVQSAGEGKGTTFCFTLSGEAV